MVRACAVRAHRVRDPSRAVAADCVAPPLSRMFDLLWNAALSPATKVNPVMARPPAPFHAAPAAQREPIGRAAARVVPVRRLRDRVRGIVRANARCTGERGQRRIPEGCVRARVLHDQWAQAPRAPALQAGLNLSLKTGLLERQTSLLT